MATHVLWKKNVFYPFHLFPAPVKILFIPSKLEKTKIPILHLFVLVGPYLLISKDPI